MIGIKTKGPGVVVVPTSMSRMYTHLHAIVGDSKVVTVTNMTTPEPTGFESLSASFSALGKGDEATDTPARAPRLKSWADDKTLPTTEDDTTFRADLKSAGYYDTKNIRVPAFIGKRETVEHYISANKESHKVRTHTHTHTHTHTRAVLSHTVLLPPHHSA